VLCGGREDVDPALPHGELAGIRHDANTPVPHLGEQLGEKPRLDLSPTLHIDRPGNQRGGVESRRARSLEIRDDDGGIPGADSPESFEPGRAQAPLARRNQHRRAQTERGSEEAQVPVEPLGLFDRPAEDEYRSSEPKQKQRPRRPG
jgi:hypothetical protein